MVFNRLHTDHKFIHIWYTYIISYMTMMITMIVGINMWCVICIFSYHQLLSYLNNSWRKVIASFDTYINTLLVYDENIVCNNVEVLTPLINDYDWNYQVVFAFRLGSIAMSAYHKCWSNLKQVVKISYRITASHFFYVQFYVESHKTISKTQLNYYQKTNNIICSIF